MAHLTHRFVRVRQNDPVESAALGKLLADGWIVYSVGYTRRGCMDFDICKEL